MQRGVERAVDVRRRRRWTGSHLAQSKVSREDLFRGRKSGISDLGLEVEWNMRGEFNCSRGKGEKHNRWGEEVSEQNVHKVCQGLDTQK